MEIAGLQDIKLTSFSHGAGCGCKIAPKILDSMLRTNFAFSENRLLVGNDTRDDAAAYDLGNGTAMISTTDFFMPIVDDPYEFGRIASANAISDVYAMGGKPVMAIAILGWPVNKIAPEVAAKVIEGSRSICAEAGIALAGGHSIDNPEPIFGLAVSGLVDIIHLKKNSTAKEGDLLFLTKPIGIGIYSTAQKKGIVEVNDLQDAIRVMTTLNKPGETFGSQPYVHAMTDVTGFGLLGHLKEMCQGAGLGAEISDTAIIKLPKVDHYLEKGAVPGGTTRNWESYGSFVSDLTEKQKTILADPQTSGGLLVAVDPSFKEDFQKILVDLGLSDFINPIGKMINGKGIQVS